MNKTGKFTILFIVITVLIFANAFALTFSKIGEITDYTQMHGLVVANNFIYVIGGNTLAEGDSRKVEFAPIDSGGVVGTFTRDTLANLPSPSNDPGVNPVSAYIEHQTFAIGSVIYRIGGSFNTANPGSFRNADSIWAAQNPDGSLKPWNILTPFPSGVTGGGGGVGAATFYTINGTTYVYAHVLPGTADLPGFRWIYRSMVDPISGALISWDTTSSPLLPAGQWFHTMHATGGKLYIWSGLTTSTHAGRHDLIWHANINPDGTLGSWSSDTIPIEFFGIYGPAMAASRYHVYVIGGRQRRPLETTAPDIGTIYRITVKPDGTLDLNSFQNMGQFTVSGHGVVTGGLLFTPARIVTVNGQERILLAGWRNRTVANRNNAILGTDSFGRSNGVFLSEPIYTLPHIIGSPTITLNPTDDITLTIGGGTGPFGLWQSSNPLVGTLSGFGANTAIFTAAAPGSTVITVPDAYGDIATVTINVTPTKAPLVPDLMTKSLNCELTLEIALSHRQY